MSKIIGITVGTPMNPQKVVEKTELEERVEAIEKAKENGEFNGADGKDGQDGADGVDGKSAYQYAKDGGYTGTEEEFAQKLAEEIGGVEVTDGEPTKASTVMTLNPNAEEVQLYTAPEIDAMFDAFINAEEVAY